MSESINIDICFKEQILDHSDLSDSELSLLESVLSDLMHEMIAELDNNRNT